jgi:hypothetical protein
MTWPSTTKPDTLKLAIRKELDSDVTALDLIARVRGAVNDRIAELESKLEKAREVRDGLLGYSGYSFPGPTFQSAYDEWTSDDDYSWMNGPHAADTINLDTGNKDYITFS